MTNTKLYKILDWCAFAVLLIIAVAVPLYFDKHLVNFYIIPKQYVFIGLTAMAFLLYCAKVVLSKKLEYRRSVLDWILVGWLFISLLSAVFSANIYDSFFGRGEYFVLNFLFLFFLALNFILNINFITTIARWRAVFDALVMVGGLTALLFVLKTVFSFDVLGLLGFSVWNSVDALNSQMGIWLITTMLLSAGFLVRQNLPIGRALAYFFVFLLSFASLILLSFNVLWWILLGGLIMLLLVAVSYVKEARMGWISVLFASLVLVVIFISFGTPKSLQSSLPAEVSLGFKPSWSIAYNTATAGFKNFLLGSGMGTFGVDFSLFRPGSFNYDQQAWSLRFNQPNNSLSAVLSEGGVLSLLALLFLIVFVLGHIFQAWYKKAKQATANLVSLDGGSTEVSLETMLISVIWLMLTGAMAVVFFGPVLWWLWFLFLGLTVTGLALSHDHITKLKVWQVDDTPQYSLSFSFTLIVVITAVIMVGVWGAKLYYGETVYARALQSKDLSSAEKEIGSALMQRASSDNYNAALAQIYLLQAGEMANKPNPDMQQVSLLVANAVNAAKKATDVSPRSVAIWENLATMYENAAVIVPDARGWAEKAIIEATNLEPSNPVLWWRLGNNYSLAGKWEDAQKAYEQAIKLKNDYLGSYVGLANVYEQKRDIDKAVETYRTIMPYALNNPEALFNFGRLLYNRNKSTDRDDAEKLWKESVRISPNYSNALYSLGLMYEARGDRARALEYYYKVKDLNPGSKDVNDKIRSMVGGSAQ